MDIEGGGERAADSTPRSNEQGRVSRRERRRRREEQEREERKRKREESEEEREREKPVPARKEGTTCKSKVAQTEMDPATSMQKSEKRKGATRSGQNPDLDNNWYGKGVQFVAWDGLNSRQRRDAQREKDGNRPVHKRKKTGAQRRREAREKKMAEVEASVIDRQFHPAKSDAPPQPASIHPSKDSASTKRATPSSEVTPQQGGRPKTPKSIVKRKTQVFSDAPSRRLFDEQPQTQKNKNVGKQRQLLKRPKLSYNEEVKERLKEWQSLPPRIPYKDTQEYKDRVRREEGHKAANFYQDPLPQRSRPSAPQGNLEEV